MKVTIKRTYTPWGTFGALTTDQGLACVTAERNWRDNKRGESCIPEGWYKLVPHKSPKFGECYAIEGPNHGVTIYGPSQRTHILIHKANWPHQLQGCIAVGDSHGVLNGSPGVVLSGETFSDLMDHLGGEEHDLLIEGGWRP